MPTAMGVLGLVALVVFGFGADPGHSSTFDVGTGVEFVDIGSVALPSRATALVLSLACLGLAGLAAAAVARRRAVPLAVPIGFAALWLLTFLVWAVQGAQISFVGLLAGALLLSVPLVFGALSGLLCERAGVINIAIEGQLLAGAFLSAVVASVTDSRWAGLVMAPVAGVLVAAVLALFAIRYVVDQIIVGVVLNVLVIGLTGFFYGRLLAPDAETFNQPDTFSDLPIPVLSRIPVIGPVLFHQSVIVYLMYVTVIAVHVALFRTRWGLRVRAVGEHPVAADTVGIAVNRIRVQNVLLGGAVAGLGGAFFTLGSVGAFGREMTAGQGFIALAAMIFGRWSPTGALCAALLFGFANNLQGVLGVIGTPIPSEFMLMAPYLATLFAVAGLAGRVRAPAADGKPYVKE
ncbi:ABC transporter permease [Pseudonocardia nigra]|uniref:ABC transporter permease n=1 Tax=Pseudonocardia nigra TaxID=1921578 RepID=UPI001C5EB5C8|nr:ABC transporter permease [Pseudonocardia nigra]